MSSHVTQNGLPLDAACLNVSLCAIGSASSGSSGGGASLGGATAWLRAGPDPMGASEPEAGAGLPHVSQNGVPEIAAVWKAWLCCSGALIKGSTGTGGAGGAGGGGSGGRCAGPIGASGPEAIDGSIHVSQNGVP